MGSPYRAPEAIVSILAGNPLGGSPNSNILPDKSKGFSADSLVAWGWWAALSKLGLEGDLLGRLSTPTFLCSGAPSLGLGLWGLGRAGEGCSDAMLLTQNG